MGEVEADDEVVVNELVLVVALSTSLDITVLSVDDEDSIKVEDVSND